MNPGPSGFDPVRGPQASESDVEWIADLASDLRALSTEREMFARMAAGLQRVLGEQAIIAVSDFDSLHGRFRPQVLSGLGPFVEKVTNLLGVRPEDLTGDYPAGVKAFLATGRLTRLPGGVSQLAGEAIPPALLRTLVTLLGMEDVYVQGFRQDDVSGGVAIITRLPGLPIRKGVIEAMTRITAVSIDRLRSEEALRNSEERYRQTVSMIPDIIWRYEVDERGNFVDAFVSPAVDRLLGLPAGTIGDNFNRYLEHVLAEDLPEVKERLAEGLKHFGQHSALDYRLRKHDGSVRWVRSGGMAHRQADGHVVGYGTTTDITDRKRIDEQLRLHSMVLDQIQDHVTVTDLDGRITFVNRAEMTTFQRSETEIVGATTDIYGEDPTRGAAQQEILRRTLQDGSWRGEVINYTRDGSERIMDCRTQVVLDERGAPVALCGIATDITERILNEQRQKQLQDQLQQAIRVEAIGRLAGGIAHDFNNMLGVIIANSELAMEHLVPDDPTRAELNEILKAARHSANLTSQLLTFARKQAIVPQVLEVNETVSRMLKLLRRLIGEGIELVFRPASCACVVRMDPSQIDQTLTNLCVNARDAIAGVGTICIETRCRDLDESFCLENATARPGSFVELSVSDTGCGMEPGLLEHLFEPFFTTKELGRGTGLGLATVDGIVRQNEGFITVRSSPGAGTTFRIFLPRLRDSAPAEVPATVQVSARLPATETILLVEDEGALLRVARRILERQGYEVLASENPLEALELAHSHPGRVHLLVTDIIMPGMNGRELATVFMKQHPDARCVFMSGYTADLIASHGVLDEQVHFLQKPFTPAQLLEMVHRALEP